MNVHLLQHCIKGTGWVQNVFYFWFYKDTKHFFTHFLNVPQHNAIPTKVNIYVMTSLPVKCALANLITLLPHVLPPNFNLSM